MVGTSMLPIALHKGQLFFLFGKEKAVEYGIQGFSDFGGGLENESSFDGAIREGCEELTGFFGNESQLRKHVKDNGGVHKINHKDKYLVHIFKTQFDPMLPIYFGNNHRYLYEKMNGSFLKSTKLFEKIQLQWMSVTDIKNNKRLFRPFYRDVIDTILNDLHSIRKFIKNTNKKNNKSKSKSNSKSKSKSKSKSNSKSKSTQKNITKKKVIPL